MLTACEWLVVEGCGSPLGDIGDTGDAVEAGVVAAVVGAVGGAVAAPAVSRLANESQLSTALSTDGIGVPA